MQALTLVCLILCCCYSIRGCPQMVVDVLWKDGLCASIVPDAVKTKRLECIMGKIPPNVLQVKQSCKEFLFQGLDNLQVLKQQCSNSTLEKQYYSCVQQNLGLPDWEDGCKPTTNNIGMGMGMPQQNMGMLQQNPILSGQQPINNQQQPLFNPTLGQLQIPGFNGQQLPLNQQQFPNLNFRQFSTGGFRQPFQNGGFRQPFQNGGFRQPFQNGGFTQPFQNGGFTQPLINRGLTQQFPNQFLQQQQPFGRLQTQQMLSSDGGTNNQMTDIAKEMLWNVAVCITENRITI
ncbi:uncharacterized protein LOC106462079 [Limulus polyphemus]|uniref:Uncharacterized protein LOC106462079 n=1 Tax=Limulus polyphemus TaxID=6850 RepID=A0ABM1B9A0_LIMPO|nr:uncharacterized protein LOC106462079 [Limulus polyphemus]